MLPLHAVLALALLASSAPQRAHVRTLERPETEDTLDLVTRPVDVSCWEPTFGGLAGTEETVQALATFDDGWGPALYAAGVFTTAGGRQANHVARWNGSSWKRVGKGISGTSDVTVAALAVFDDGNGEALYAGGTLTSAGGVPANHVARWNGSSWSALGSGVGSSFGGGLAPAVLALTVFDDGSGSALYAAGTFTIAGGIAASRIARWNGLNWSALGSGVNADVRALTVFDDGSGAALYAAGTLTSAGGVAANRIAKWNGTSWSPLGSGLSAPVRSLTVFDDGSGPALYAGGQFTSAGGSPANRIAKWDGSSWSALGSGLDGAVHALAVFDDGGGPALFAGGEISLGAGDTAGHIAKWDGASWGLLGRGTNGPVLALSVFDGGAGAALFAGGTFDAAFFDLVSVEAHHVAKWDGSSWAALGVAGPPSDAVLALAEFDDGTGPALYAGGSFDFAGGAPAIRIAKWDGASWSPLSWGMLISGTSAEVRTMAVFDDGSGPALYVGGRFAAVDFVNVNHVAKWDGTSWSALGTGMNSAPVECLQVFDDGSGPALYAGGAFTMAGGVAANHIAKWNGSSWSAVGPGTNGTVSALVGFNDGSGTKLYAGGGFTTAGGAAIEYLARWNGSFWTGVGPWGGMSSSVSALTVFNGALFAGGTFTSAGNAAASHVAKWNGAIWAAVGGGTDGPVRCFTTFDDGTGPALYAGGDFTNAGGAAANRIARWNGASWEPLGQGTSGSVAAMAVSGQGQGAALFVGGSFGSAHESGDSFLAKWRCTEMVQQPAFRRR